MSRSTPRPRSGLVTLVVVTLLLAPATGVLITAAQPTIPESYYGNVTINGDPAPVGVVVSATVNGTVEDTITVETAGQYGGPGAFDEKLTVNASENATVRFTVAGIDSGTTDPIDPGNVTQLNLSVSDTQSPTADAGEDRTVQPDTTVQFDASGSSDNGQILNYSWSFGDGTSGSGETPTHTYTDPGTYTVELTVRDAGGNTDTDTLTITVESGGGGGGSGGGSGGSGGSGGGGGAGGGSGGGGGGGSSGDSGDDGTGTSEETGDQQISVSTPAENKTRVTVRNASPTAPVNISIGQSADDETGVGVSGIRLNVSEETDFQLNVSSRTRPPADTPPVNTSEDATALSYLEVDTSLDATQVANATIEFTVSRSRLRSMNRSPGAVTLRRYTDGEWTTLPTKLKRTRADAYVFTARSPGFSVFAVSVSTSDIAIRETALAPSSVRAGQSVNVTVTLTNNGSASGTRNVSLTVGNRTVSTRTVTLDPGASRRLVFTPTLTRAGTFDVAVDGRVIGRVSVTAQTTTATTSVTTTETTDTTQTPIGGDEETTVPTTTAVTTQTTSGQPGFSVLAAVVAMLVVLLLRGRRSA